MGITHRFDRDLFHSLPTKAAAQTTIAALNAIQDRRPECQVAGLAAAFLLVCEKYGMPAQDAFTATRNMMHGHKARGGYEFDAAQSYLSDDVFGAEPDITF